MKYVRFSVADKVKYGILEENVIKVLSNSYFEEYVTTQETYQLDQIHILAPVKPSKAVCVGLNYGDHAKEMCLPLPPTPILFMKPSTATIGPNDSIIHPRLSERVDYEGELAVVIKRRARHISIDDVPKYILGYTIANDVTARDLQKSDGQWTVAKGFDTFMPLGPIISDEVDPSNLSVITYLNNNVVQKSNTKHLIFSAYFLVSYISSIMTLNPGDVILTGTPGGIGKMEVGDVVRVEIEGLLSLTNTLKSE